MSASVVGLVFADVAGDATGRTTQSFTVTNAIPAGDTVMIDYAGLASSGGAIAFTVSDTRGNTWSTLASLWHTGNEEVAILGSKLTTALQVGDTITVAHAGQTRTRQNFVGKSYHGLTFTVDVSNTVQGSSKFPAISFTTGNAGELIHSAVCYASATSVTTATWAGSYTDTETIGSVAGSTEKSLTVGTYIGSAAGTEGPTTTLSSIRSWAMVGVAMVASSGANVRTASDSPSASESASSHVTTFRTTSDAASTADAVVSQAGGSTALALTVIPISTVAGDATSTASMVCFVARTAPVGTLMVLDFGCLAGAAGTTFTVTDSKGNTWSVLAQTFTANKEEVALFGSILSTALVAGDTVTIGMSTARSRRNVISRGYSGAGAITLDGSAVTAVGNNQNGTLNLTTTQQGDLVLVAGCWDAAPSVNWITEYTDASENITSAAGSSDKTLGGSYHFAGVATTETPSLFFGVTTDWTLAAVAIKASRHSSIVTVADGAPVTELPARKVTTARTSADGSAATEADVSVLSTAHVLHRVTSDAAPVTELPTHARPTTVRTAGASGTAALEANLDIRLSVRTTADGTAATDSVVSLLVHGGVVVAGTLKVNRWTITDPDDVTLTWFFERNPNKVDSPNLKRTIDTMSTGAYFQPYVRGIRQANLPVDWSFSGTGTTQTMFDALWGWAQARRLLNITDDLGRTYTVLPLSFEPVDRAPTPRHPVNFGYVFRCKLFAEPIPVASAVVINTGVVSQWPAPVYGPADGGAPVGVVGGRGSVGNTGGVPVAPTPDPLLPPGPSGAHPVGLFAGGQFVNGAAALVGSSQGTSTLADMVTSLIPDIVRVPEGQGVVPASWPYTAAAPVPGGTFTSPGTPVIYSLKPDVNVLAQYGTLTAYTALVAALVSTLSGMPDIDGQRVIMWPTPFGKHFTAASWCAASINFFNDVLSQVNVHRQNRIRYVINLSGSMTSAQIGQYLTAATVASCDEIGFDCTSPAQVTAAGVVAASWGRPLVIPSLSYGRGVFHTDAQIQAWMMANVPAMFTQPGPVICVCWSNSLENQIASGRRPLAAAYWSTVSGFQAVVPLNHLIRVLAEFAPASESVFSRAPHVHLVAAVAEVLSIAESPTSTLTAVHQTQRTAADGSVASSSSAVAVYTPKGTAPTTIFGLAPNSAIGFPTWQSVAATFDNGAGDGRLAAVRLFDGGGPSPASTMPADGRVVITSFKPAFGDVAAGAYDPVLRDYKNLGIPMYITAWHEVNGGAGRPTTAAQIAAWKTDIAYMANFFAGSTVKTCIIFTGTGYATYPTFKVAGVTCYGVDFDGIPHTTGAYPSTHYVQALNYITSTIQPDGNEVIVGEFGSTLGTDDPTGSARAAWELQWCTSFRNAGITVVTWWDSTYGWTANDTTALKTLI